MKQFDVVLGLMIGLLPIFTVLLVVVHPLITLIGLAILAVWFAFYGAIMDSIVWRAVRRERERESELGERSVDAFLEAVKSRYGAPAAEYISKQKWSIPQAIDFLREHEKRQRLAKNIDDRKVA